MEWIATAIAVIAAAAAIWQAFEARQARSDAESAAKEARDTEERTVSAAERTARALEEQAAMERAEREKYRNPWVVRRDRDQGSVAVEFRLGGDESVSEVRIQHDAEKERLSLRGDIPNPMRPGQAVTVWWSRSMASPPSIDVNLSWTRPNGDQHDFVLTLP